MLAKTDLSINTLLMLTQRLALVIALTGAWGTEYVACAQGLPCCSAGCDAGCLLDCDSNCALSESCAGCCQCCACDCQDCYQPGALLRLINAVGPDTAGKGRKKLADKLGPAGIAGDHVHKQDSFMAEYKYMNMYMGGNRFGTQGLTNQQALAVGQALGTNFGATPTRMTMEMHMLHLMYGWTNDVTVYTMLTFDSLSMDHLRNTPFPPNPPLAGTRFATHNSGFDDIVFGALIRLCDCERRQLILNLGFSAPTGDIVRTTTAPTGGLVVARLPYPMRRGSGTFDLMPGITYKRYFDCGSLGYQCQADIPVGQNRQGYRVGESIRMNAWYSHLLRDWLAVSLRVEGRWRENYHGVDPTLNPAVISTARADMRGGEIINLGYGVNSLLRNNHLIRGEITHPVYQNLDGVQLESDWNLIVSWSKGW